MAPGNGHSSADVTPTAAMLHDERREDEGSATQRALDDQILDDARAHVRISHLEGGVAQLRKGSLERYGQIRTDIADVRAAVLDLQGQRKRDADVATRRYAHLAEGQSTILSRLDKAESDDAARDAATASVHLNAQRARDEVAALGAQQGAIAAEVVHVRETTISITSEVAHTGQRVASIETAHKGWLATGRLLGAWVLEHRKTFIGTLVGIAAGALGKHLLGH